MLKQYVLLAAVAMSLFGCASVPMGDSNKDATLKTFAGKPDIASVYIYRNESLGPVNRIIVQIDGKFLGKTVPFVYLYTDISPGKHVISSTSLNPYTSNPTFTDNLEFEAIAGKRYYVWQEYTLGFPFPKSKLHLVDEAEGQKGVLETRLAESQ
jgi:hypothetical protein